MSSQSDSILVITLIHSSGGEFSGVVPHEVFLRALVYRFARCPLNRTGKQEQENRVLPEISV
jgi:hypothetical protein